LDADADDADAGAEDDDGSMGLRAADVVQDTVRSV